MQNDDMFDSESLLSLFDEMQNEEELDLEISALNANVDIKVNIKSIDDYDHNIFSDAQLSEIEIGLEHKIDVDIYADAELSARQMRELRYGLERNLNIKIYNNKFFREKQMQEIRTGLQYNLPVEKYARIILSPTDMRNKRMVLFQERYGNRLSEISFDYDDKETGIHIYIEAGLMEAGIVLKNPLPEKFTKSDLKKLLVSYDIVEGFNERLLPQNLSNLPTGVKIPVAFGKPSQKGKDGEYEYKFMVTSAKPIVRENGTVDYAGNQEYTHVNQGDTVVVYHKPEIGEDGISVIGFKIKGLIGNELDPIKNEDLIMSPDGSSYTTKKSGFISLVNGTIRVMENLTFNEDITANSGKISFDGTIQIKGSVCDNACIVATGDIIINGFVQSAKLVSGGDIIITGGVNADEKGELIANGNITAGFFENVEAHAGGNIEVGYILSSDVVAEGIIKTTGRKSLICGGHVCGKKGVISNSLGNSSGVKTIIEAGGPFEELEEYLNVSSQKNSLEAEISKMTSAMQALVAKIGAALAEKNDTFVKLQELCATKREEIKNICTRLEELEEKRQDREKINVEISGDVFENVTICINENKMLIKEILRHPKFRCEGRSIKYD